MNGPAVVESQGGGYSQQAHVQRRSRSQAGALCGWRPTRPATAPWPGRQEAGLAPQPQVRALAEDSDIVEEILARVLLTASREDRLLDQGGPAGLNPGLGHHLGYQVGHQDPGRQWHWNL